MGVVTEAVIQVVVTDGGPSAEGELAAIVGEQVQAVVVVVLHDGQRGVEHHPVDEIGHLAHTAPHAAGRRPIGDGQPLPEPPASSGVAYQPPEREGLPWPNEHCVDPGRGQGQVDRLVFLEAHIHIAQPPADEGAVLVNEHRQELLLPCPGEPLAGEDVFYPARPPLLISRDAVRQRTDLAEQLAGHTDPSFSPIILPESSPLNNSPVTNADKMVTKHGHGWKYHPWPCFHSLR